MAFGGSMKFNPMTDSIGNFKFEPPTGEIYPNQGYATKDSGYMAPTMSGEVVIRSQERAVVLSGAVPETGSGGGL